MCIYINISEYVMRRLRSLRRGQSLLFELLEGRFRVDATIALRVQSTKMKGV